MVYSVVYTIYHNSPVVWCLYTTSGLWFVVIMVNKKRHLDWNEITIDKKNNWYFAHMHKLKLFELEHDFIHTNEQSILQITIHLLYIDTIQQVNCEKKTLGLKWNHNR
jgi:hypothetical protein